MPIPDFQSVMLPLLRHISGGREYSSTEINDALALHFQLTQDERNALLPSRRQKVFDNRVAWAKAHLKIAGLLHTPNRGITVITEKGLNVLKKNPKSIDLKFLRQFPEYLERVDQGRKKPEKEKSAAGVVKTQPAADFEKTPQEVLEEAFESIMQELSAELLAQIKAGSPAFFEQVVIDLLVRMGYGGTFQDAGQSLGRTGDEGLDGVIKEDRLGLDVIYVQAKKWGSNHVGRPDIQKFAGALQGKRARKGVFITTSTFSQGARDYADSIDRKIVLIDGQELAGLMIEHDVGVTTTSTYEVKRIDYDYFEDG